MNEELERAQEIVEQNNLLRTVLKRIDTLEARVKALEDHCKLPSNQRCPYCGHPEGHQPWCENKQRL